MSMLKVQIKIIDVNNCDRESVVVLNMRCSSLQFSLFYFAHNLRSVCSIRTLLSTRQGSVAEVLVQYSAVQYSTV